jgi:hypothetical protein
MDQVSIKYTNIFQRTTVQNLPKFGFLVWKQTIWQPWSFRRALTQGGQMVNFQTKKPNLAKFWRVLEWKLYLYMYFMVIWNPLRPFGKFYSRLEVCYIKSR